jgi:hypothetical protein
VRYEQLVLDTESTLRWASEFIELPWDPVMLDYHEGAAERHQGLTTGSRAARNNGVRSGPVPMRSPRSHLSASGSGSEQEMSPADRAIFEREEEDLLCELGYAPAEASATASGRSG